MVKSTKDYTKVNVFERFSLKIMKWIGTPSSILFHTAFFAGIFSLRFFGLPADTVMLTLTTVASFEVIYLALLIQMNINRNAQNIIKMDKNTQDIQEGEEKTHTALIHLGHQIRSLQHEFETLKKSGILKTNGQSGNGHKLQA